MCSEQIRMKKQIYIYGAGGLGREVLALLRRIGSWDIKGFIDDSQTASHVRHVPVVGGMEQLKNIRDAFVVVAIGDPVLKKKIAARIPDNLVCEALIDPDARLLAPSSVKIGRGSIICAGVVITTEVQIGDHVLINLNSTVGHDCTIGSYSSIMPGSNIAGEVHLGECVLVGSGSCIRNLVRVGDESKLGMGTVVLNDVAPAQMIVGVPGRPKHLDKK